MTAPQTPGREQGTCGASLWRTTCSLRLGHTGDHGIRQHGACTNCGHVRCEGGRPCGALLRVSAVSEHRCFCTEGAPNAAPQTPGREQEIRARAEALEADRVFPGSTWTASAANEKSTLPPENAWVVEDVLKRDTVEIRGSVGIFGSQQHAGFAAHAREDIPWLLDRVAELEADRDAAVAAAVRRALEDAAKRQREFVLSDDFVCDDWESALTVVDLIDPAVVSPAREQGEETADTLPAWLYQRFGKYPIGVDWDELPETDQEYWAREASAVRRAVTRGGFKTHGTEATR